MPEIDLWYCMSLPPARAIEYLTQKGFAISWAWEDVWQEAQAQAFTVAKVTKLDILQDIRTAVEQALAEGRTQVWFDRTLTPLLKAKGWWGRAEEVDAATGEISAVQMGSPWRLRTIYRTNAQTAYMAGRFRAQLANVDDRPWWQYTAVMDGVTRPTHRALHGKVLRYDDPFWASFYPPNGWGCRCRVVALAGSDLAGGAVESSKGRLGSAQRPIAGSGDMREVTTYLTTDQATGKPITVSPDVGWNYNPGAAAWVPDVTRYTGPLATLARRELP